MFLKNSFFLIGLFGFSLCCAMRHVNNDLELVVAAGHGDMNKVQALISLGADIHYKKNCAVWCAAQNGHGAVVELLLKNGVNGAHINGSRMYGHGSNNALTIAAKKGHEVVVRLLLEAGANVHYTENLALFCAANEGHENVVRLLLQSGADINIALSRMAGLMAKAKAKSNRDTCEEAVQLLTRCNDALRSVANQNAANQNANNNNVPKAIMYATLDNKKSSME